MDAAGPIALIAGDGQLPAEAKRCLEGQGMAVHPVAFRGVSETALALDPEPLPLGRLAALRERLDRVAPRGILIVGRFDRALMGRADVLDPDAEGLALLARLRDAPDPDAMGAIADWLEGAGFPVLRQDHWLAPLLAGAAPLGGRSPDDAATRDLEVGRRALESADPRHAGQAVVVRDGRVVARESAAGTDALIAEAATRAGPGFTLVKGARPGQDPRLDLPAIGPVTIDALARAGAARLAVEAEATLVIDRSAVCARIEATDLLAFAYSTRPADEAHGGGPA